MEINGKQLQDIIGSLEGEKVEKQDLDLGM